MSGSPPSRGRIEPVKLFVAVLYREDERTGARSPLEEAARQLHKKYGEEDYRSRPVPFDHTAFYEREFGGPLWRLFISFRELVPPGALVEAKLEAERIERALARPDGSRTVNLDPGTIDYQKVVLASFKYQGQKIYLDHGVWADLTLYYRKGGWAAFEWTFPDFKSGRYDRDLLEIRARYKRQMTAEQRPGKPEPAPGC